MNSLLQTQRLRLLLLASSQLKQCLENLPVIEAHLGLRLARGMFTDRAQQAIKTKLDKMHRVDASLQAWFTYWLVVTNLENVGIGLVGFKGSPNKQGAVEIGYGIDPVWQNRGYATEAVQALLDWAFQHPYCTAITATEVCNPASRRVLEKLGARLIEKSESHTSWEFTRQASALAFDSKG